MARQTRQLICLIGIWWFLASVQAVLGASLRLGWNDNSTDETGFRIQRWDGVAYRDITQVGKDIQTYTDQNVVAGLSYCYRVLAFNSSGVSTPSNESCKVAAEPQPSTEPTGDGGSTSPSTEPTQTNDSESGAVSPAAWTDYRFMVKMRSDDNDTIGALFRYVDSNNFYRFTWDRQTAIRQLVKVKNGVVTVLAKDAVRYRSGQTYQFEVVVDGPKIAVWIDARQIFSVEDASFNRGNVALFSYYNKGSVFDDVFVEDVHTGTVLLSADFNDGTFSGWTVMEETSQDGPSNWSVVKGKLVQSSNIGEFSTRGLGTVALFSQQSWSDYRFKVKIRSDDDDTIGALFRYVDSNNFYRFTWDQETSSRQLVRIKDDAVTVLMADAVAYQPGRTYQLEIVAQGSSLEVWIDARRIFSVEDASFARGRFALFSYYNDGSIFDDVVVEDVHTGDVLLSDDFNDGNFSGWTVMDETSQGGPSSWSVVNGKLLQSSNIGQFSSRGLGTIALFSQ